MNVKKMLTTTYHQTCMKVKKNSPEILLGMGLIGMGGTIFLACKATLSAEEILEDHKERLETIKEAKKIAEENPEDYEYDEIVEKQDKLIVYTKTAASFVKLYAPSIALGAFSVACILSSRNILHKRYVGAVSAYNALSGVFEAYRNRVREEQGELMDRHYRYGTEIGTDTVSVVDSDGNKKKEKVNTEKILPKNILSSDSARMFGPGNPYWDDNRDFDIMLLKGQENYFNDIFHEKGYLFLNEVYEALGFEATQEGCILGWVKGSGDDYVDIGIRDPQKMKRFRDGLDDELLLDFNHDGIIWDKI